MSAHGMPLRTRNAVGRSNTSTTLRHHGGLQDRSGQGSFEDFARDRFIIGDKVSVKEEIARYRELLGVDHFIMRCQWPGLPQERVLSSIQRLGEIFTS
jgi:alkanesulfonate monooxygenase SsuD/methylene tetrahydromethanopterin reductase-like flavin-dependent oxidoreductase (luciferase family)